MTSIKTYFFGDRQFYKKILTIAIPIMLQNGITNFVGFLDNIMIGQLGTDQMSGVSIVNQLFFVFFLCIFGAVSGAGIFTAQYFGKGDLEGVRETFRFKLYSCLTIAVISIFVFLIFGNQFIRLFLHEGSDTGNILATLGYAHEYLIILIISFIPFVLMQIYASTLREIGKTILPMIASIIAVVVNLFLNYVLIFGKFGFPALGVKGAAIATLCSRIIEALVVILWIHSHTRKNPFIIGVFRSLHVSKKLIGRILIKGSPLMVNEILWALGMTTVLQCYSLRGLAVVGGFNIANTINNVFNIVFIALGDTIAIIVGQYLGANRNKEAIETARKIITFSVLSCTGIGSIMVLCAPLFPSLYNTTTEVKQLATSLIRTYGLIMPMFGFLHATYFTLRSGGKTLITFVFDSVYVWCLTIPVAYAFIKLTNLPVSTIFLFVSLTDIFKCILGFILVKKKVWVQNIIS